MKWKEILNDYLSFTRKERIGVITILFILVLAIFFPLFFSQSDVNTTQAPDSTWIAATSELEQKKSENDRSDITGTEENMGSYQFDQRRNSYYKPAKPGQLFYFDPNTLSADGWKKLGLSRKTIHTIQNYLAKGGHFKKPEDLRRIYSLRNDEYERLAPYIRIEQNTKGMQPPRIFTEIEPAPAYNQFQGKSRLYQPVDINLADTTALIQLPGIGSKLASRIISFRDKLGGFYNVEQVSETFGLPDSTFQKVKQYLKLETTTVRKLNINTSTTDELKTHPYIKFNIAKAILAYRNEHGSFSDVGDLKKIMIITDEVYNKISPYLTTIN